MKQYNYEEIDKYIQWLIKMMNIEYPNNYELIINSNSGTIRNTQTDLMFLRQDLKNYGFNDKSTLEVLLNKSEKDGDN